MSRIPERLVPELSPRAPLAWRVALRLATLAALLVTAATPTRAATLDFDELAEGTVVDEHYAFMGIHISANGPGLVAVIAAPPCETPVSPPYVLSYQDLGECPAARDESGHFEVLFDEPQNLVAITAVHRSPDTVAYLEAYGVDGFIDADRSTPGAGSTGVPQRLVVTPPPDRPRVTRILFGVERNGGSAFFDDLELDVVVETQAVRWGSWKARWR